MASSTRKVTFKPPQGVVPESTQVGDTFDLVSTFRLEGDGNVCLTVMGETKMTGYDNDKEAKPVYREEAKAMTETAPEAPDYG